MTKSIPTKAVIYCCTATTGSAALKKLHAQEERCTTYAKAKGCDVIAVFRDKGISGTEIDRQGCGAMLSFIKAHSGETGILVIIEDASRLARNVTAHVELRNKIGEAGGILHFSSHSFPEGADGEFMELMISAVGQYEHDKKKRS